MGSLRSALDELRSSDVGSASDDEVFGDLEELERASRVIEAERARRLVEVERRGAFAFDGALSMTAWWSDRVGISRAVASAHVRVARALHEMPQTLRALSDGEISSAAVALLIDAREACVEDFAAAEPMLVDAARSLSVAQLKLAVAYWRERVDARADEAHERRFGRRRLFVSPLLDGMVRVDGDLDPETGSVLMTALSAVCDADARTREDVDERTPAQRRADALGEICRQWLDTSARPVVAGERPHVVVTMDLEALESRAGRRCELDGTGAIDGESARRLACDANVTRLIVDAASEPLDVGRTTKVVSTALRRAVIARDGGCRFPGCERPPGWCDAHHVRHWADGGETALANLVLLCRPHHRLVHRGFGVEMQDGRPRFSRPDGSALPERRPPPRAMTG